MNGVSVEENNFDGDRLRELNIRIYITTSVVVSMMLTFCFMMFDSVNSIISIIAIIMFAGSILTGIILMIRFFVKYKSIKQMERQYYEDFVVNQPVKFQNLTKSI